MLTHILFILVVPAKNGLKESSSEEDSSEEEEETVKAPTKSLVKTPAKGIYFYFRKLFK